MESIYSGIKHKTKIIKLFRSILRERLKLPTENRRQFVLHKARTEFREGSKVSDPKEIRSLLIIGNTHLDTVMIQAKHLCSILEYEPTPIEIQMMEKSGTTPKPLSADEQKTLKINQEYVEMAKKEQKLRDAKEKDDMCEDNIR
ncbi:hypothetical protein DFA_00346 [Cavenderia fasciculata]|uniref:Complex 1 LYR protein domain-containing protein n=1 Tax=Cavenderia fasciculata TaxID=261658 RepID=F4PRD3_CACFS|nr:uncharacterized protein DFA_00346 [Cavenderia fasciculata]EGG20485.1 hypothetical protein DFA_00346 [Cavenderia fasciculata]|eukprot:XP_004358335.1 hypothetical protein DFA_00346 [Cavenderia fasciculata]